MASHRGGLGSRPGGHVGFVVDIAALRQVPVGFVVGKAELGQVFSEYFGFPC
jgi:hypothetical protein